MSRVRTKLMQVLKKRLQRSIFWCFTLSLFPGLVEIHGQAVQASQARAPVLVNVQKNLSRLIEEEDTDGDKKLTLDDTYIKGKGRGDKRFWLIATNGKRYEVVGTYYLSNLLQELRLHTTPVLVLSYSDIHLVGIKRHIVLQTLNLGIRILITPDKVFQIVIAGQAPIGSMAFERTVGR